MKLTMQGRHLFEYAVMRVVPHVEREEFVNVGVILYCHDLKFLDTRMTLNASRIRAFCEEIDLDEVQAHMTSFHQICTGGKEAGRIGALPMRERFRWLTASRSTILQTSPVHPGMLENPGEMLDRLFEQLVK